MLPPFPQPTMTSRYRRRLSLTSAAGNVQRGSASLPPGTPSLATLQLSSAEVSTHSFRLLHSVVARIAAFVEGFVQRAPFVELHHET